MKNYIFKKSVKLFLLISSLFGMAQVGNKVGIDIEMPMETLHINGTLRVQDLPKDREGQVYDGQNVKRTLFVATRSIVADDKGNLGYKLLEENTSQSAYIKSGFYAKIRRMGTDKTINPDDYTVIARAGNLVLPNPSQNKDRILIVCVESVANSGPTNLNVSSEGGADIILPTLYPNQRNVVLSNGGTRGGAASGCTQFHSDGKNWYGTLSYTR